MRPSSFRPHMYYNVHENIVDSKKGNLFVIQHLLSSPVNRGMRILAQEARTGMQCVVWAAEHMNRMHLCFRG